MSRIDKLKEDMRALVKHQHDNPITNDPEINHEKADKILCDILEELGCSDVVENFNRIQKWYS